MRKNHSNYFESADDFRMYLNEGETRNFYFLANTTRFIGDDWTADGVDLHDEANIGRLTYAVDSYQVFKTTGLPMAKAFPGWVKGTSSTNFILDQQTARLTLKLDQITKDNVHLTVKGVTIRNAVRKIRPFDTEDGFKAESTDDLIVGKEENDKSEHASEADVTYLNEGNGGYALFYVLENRQGDLLPDNTDTWEKTADAEGLGDKKGLVTYIDIECSATTQASVVDKIHYNVCLGRNNTSNFDVTRGMESELTINYITDNINDHKWKQTSEGQDPMGKFDCSKTVATVCPGIDDVVYIYGIGRDDFIDIDESSITLTGDAEGLTYSIEKLSDCYKVTFSTSRTISNEETTIVDINDEEIPSSDATFSFSSFDAYNGEANAKGAITVKTYNAIFPIQFRYDDESGYLEARSNNPMELGFKFSVNGSANGRSISGSAIKTGEYRYDDRWHKKRTESYLTNSLGKEWTRIVPLGKDITATSGMILNIDVTPCTPDMDYGSIVPAEPMFKNGTKLYNGEGRTATYGPGTYITAAEFTTTGWSTAGNSGSTYGGIYGDNGRVYFEFSSNQNPHKFTVASNAGEFSYQDNVETNIYTYTGWTREHNESLIAGYTTSFLNRFSFCPFYVTNADLRGYSSFTDIVPIQSGDVKWGRIEYYSIQSGRDLFTAYDERETEGLSAYSWLGMDIWAKQQWLGASLKVWYQFYPYTFGTHLTINGWTSWPLADESIKGSKWN